MKLTVSELQKRIDYMLRQNIIGPESLIYVGDGTLAAGDEYIAEQYGLAADGSGLFEEISYD